MVHFCPDKLQPVATDTITRSRDPEFRRTSSSFGTDNTPDSRLLVSMQIALAAFMAP